MHASCSPCICSGQCQKLPRTSQKPHSEPPSSPSPPLRLNTTSCQTMKLQHDRNKHALRLGYIPRQVCCHSCACHNQACGTHTMPQPAHNSTRNGSTQSHTPPCHNSTQPLVQAAQPVCIAERQPVWLSNPSPLSKCRTQDDTVLRTRFQTYKQIGPHTHANPEPRRCKR